jgi:hypothetical protein
MRLASILGGCGLALLLGAGLPGCAARGYYQAVEAVETGVIEPEVDAALEKVVMRLCRLPTDIMVRQVEQHGLRVLQAAILVCPEWRAISGYFVSDAIDRLGALSPELIKAIAGKVETPAPP